MPTHHHTNTKHTTITFIAARWYWNWTLTKDPPPLGFLFVKMYDLFNVHQIMPDYWQECAGRVVGQGGENGENSVDTAGIPYHHAI